MNNVKKLIEVALPLEEINKESAREKSIRHGHPSTLHLWWARRPLATARAVIWSSLVDDPSCHPDRFPTEEAQRKERVRLFDILTKLVKWENSNDESVFEEAMAEIMKSTMNNPPALLDPFAGGGTIPLEAQRLGLVAHAHDLNPVAVMINKAMIEIPPEYAGQRPVNPEARRNMASDAAPKGATGLANDVRYYGEWMKQEAWKRIGHLYPSVEVPVDQGGGKGTAIAYIWARTVKCPNPACGCEMPLVSTFSLSNKKGMEYCVVPKIYDNLVEYHVEKRKKAPEATKVSRGGNFKCIVCGSITTSDYIRSEAVAGNLGCTLIAIVAETKTGKAYISPDSEQIALANSAIPLWKPEEKVPYPCHDVDRLPMYGMPTWGDAFTKRQLTALSTYSELVNEAKKKIVEDCGNEEYANGICLYLAFAVDRLADYCSKFATWSGEFIAHTFGRQAIPMVWDFAEVNPFSNSTGNWSGAIDWICRVIEKFPINPYKGFARQFDAQSDCGLRNLIISTDPPYYDNISYADVSDYFYVWLRHSLKDIYPASFRTLLSPKSEELVASPYRFKGGLAEAKGFFEEGMAKACKQMREYAGDDIPITIYYAYKQSEVENENTASSGWETMLTAVIHSGFIITGTWPMRTERTVGIKGSSNMLASSIVLVCRKRPEIAGSCTRREFINALHRELRPALEELQSANIAPVDMAQSAIGPGIGVFSRYKDVLEADGKPMSVRAALQIINQELDAFYNEQEGELDRESRFCVDIFNQYAFNTMKFGDADVLARAKNTSVQALVDRGVMEASKGNVRLLTREEIPTTVHSTEECIWLLTQQLAHAMETGGVKACATILMDMYGSNAENAKALAYRLYTICERKNWAQEGYAYNNLVVAWPEIISMAAQMKEAQPVQMKMDI